MQNPLSKKKEITVYNPAKGVYSFKIVFVNVIMVAVAGTENKDKPEWVLIDAGLKGFSKRIKRVAEKQFGVDNPPRAIILTHGHFDHVGSLEKLLAEWNVPVFCHRLELPYLTGKSAYPPQDPTVDNGMMAMLSRIYPTGPINLGERILPLPADGKVPFLDAWKWYHVPGHAPGQVALFREKDRTLISADAFVTTNQESAYSVITQRRKINGPPAYFTIDWQAAETSVFLLEKLRPNIVVSGHGRPMEGSKMRKQLRELAHHFQDNAIPKHGRYVQQPAKADERGVVDVPPAVMDALPRVMAGVALASIAAATTYILLSRSLNNKSRSSDNSEAEEEEQQERRSETGSESKRKSAKKAGSGSSAASATKKSASKKQGKKTAKPKAKKAE